MTRDEWLALERYMHFEARADWHGAAAVRFETNPEATKAEERAEYPLYGGFKFVGIDHGVGENETALVAAEMKGGKVLRILGVEKIPNEERCDCPMWMTKLGVVWVGG